LILPLASDKCTIHAARDNKYVPQPWFSLSLLSLNC